MKKIVFIILAILVSFISFGQEVISDRAALERKAVEEIEPKKIDTVSWLEDYYDAKLYKELYDTLKVMTDTEIYDMIGDNFPTIIDEYSFDRFCKDFPGYREALYDIRRKAVQDFCYSSGRFVGLRYSFQIKFFDAFKMRQLIWQKLENEAIMNWDGEKATYYAKKRLGYFK